MIPLTYRKTKHPFQDCLPGTEYGRHIIQFASISKNKAEKGVNHAVQTVYYTPVKALRVALGSCRVWARQQGTPTLGNPETLIEAPSSNNLEHRLL